jgi:arylsulfatase A-like enzyme
MKSALLRFLGPSAVTCTAVVWLSLFVSSSSLANERSDAAKPNVLVILVDDLGWGDVGFNGGRDIPTPHLDALAANGVRFKQGYVTAPQCAPSRAGLLSGIDQNRFGRPSNPYLDDLGMPAHVKLFGEYMRDQGYRTALIGKWHVGTMEESHPLARGFDRFFGHLGGSTTFFLPRPREHPIFDGREEVELSDYLTFALGKKAIDFIKEESDQPFFLLLSHLAPHEPLQAPDEYIEKFRHLADDDAGSYVDRTQKYVADRNASPRQIYAAMVSALDDSIGEVMQALREQGLEEKTLVWFLSDNGGPTTVTGASNKPLRGMKGDVIEGGTRVPFAMQWKGTVPGGQTIDTPVSSLDILPTSLAATGADLPEALDGENLLPLLTEGKALADRALLWRFPYPAHYHVFGVRRGDMKLVSEALRGPGGIDWAEGKGGKVGLYRITEDPAEENDLSARSPEVREKLQSEYDAWHKTLPAL